VSKKLAGVDRHPGRHHIPGKQHESKGTMGSGGTPGRVAAGVVAISVWVDDCTRVASVVVAGSA
jgi:hypothetical protein